MQATAIAASAAASQYVSMEAKSATALAAVGHAATTVV
jgi:hypothetical protein